MHIDCHTTIDQQVETGDYYDQKFPQAHKLRLKYREDFAASPESLNPNNSL